MLRITIIRRKFNFSFLAVIAVLLTIVSITLGTVISSASSSANLNDDEKSRGENSLFASSQSEKVADSFLAAKEFLFSKNSQPSLRPSSTFVVNSSADTNDAAPGDGVCADSSGNCTLRAAIQEANATVGTDEITFNFTAPTTIQLNSNFSPAELVISEGVTITGPGARILIVKGNSNTLAGVFNINASATTTTSISGITIANSGGRGVTNDGKLNLSDAAVYGNQYGIYNSGKLNLSRATVASNSNGGVYINGSSTVNISNTTITNNTSSDNGGGIYTASSDVTLNNVTISHNSAAANGGGLYYNGSSAGVYVRNTIIANNTAPNGTDVFSANNLTGASFASRGNNLVGKSDVNAGFIQGVNGDQVGTIATPIDPLLGLLQNNGGQTDTRAIQSASPAKDAGNMCVINSSCASNNPAASLLTDQRGTNFPRYYQAGVDIGAFELFYPTASINSLNPGNWGTGRGSFVLTVNGANFVANSVVNFNGQARATTFVSNTQLKVQILAADVATGGQYPVTVTNPEPGGGTSDPVNFAVADCSYTLNPASQNFTASGGTGSTSVTAINGCIWTATSNAPWITITSGSDTGSGTVSFTVAANTGVARTGTINVNGQIFTVTQNSGCTYSLSPTSGNFSAAAATNSFNVTTSNNSCSWSATTDAPWITITAASGTGNGAVSYSVAANNGPARSGIISVNGETFTVNQSSGCAYTLLPFSTNIEASGGSGNFSVTTVAGCTWTAASNVPWIIINSGASGTGNGTVGYSVAANSGPARTGTITVNGQTFTVNQNSGCTYSISSTSLNAAAGGGNGSVNVTAINGCAWTASSNVSWVTVTAGASGTGNGTVTFSVAPNTGPARTGTITIAGQTFTVSQASGCTYTLSPPSANFDVAGGSGSFNVTPNNPGCTWTATASDSWITINSGAAGTGNGAVSYTVQANVSPARTGTINVNGQVYTINQNNGCTYTLSSPNTNIPAAGGNGTFSLNSGTGCPWNVQSNVSWITITSSASGTGSAVISFTVAANTGPLRSGTITAGGLTFTVTQDNGCAYTLSAYSTGTPAAGGNGSANVTSSSGCAWTAVSNAAWITVTSGASGSGNGTVAFTVAANTGPARSGTITIAGQTFTVNQDSGCSYLLTPTSTSFNESGGNRSFTITTGAGCQWTAVSNAPWITITSGASGTGNGTVTFSVAANTGAERTGTISAGGKIFTVYQVSLLVTNLNDSGSGSLRQAVINANNTPDDDVIVFQSGLTGSILLTGGEITIANNGALEIRGPGANILAVSGNNNSRIFYTNYASTVTISDLTLTGGNGVGADSDNFNKYGGAIYANQSSLTLNRVQIVANNISVPNSRGNTSVGGAVFYYGGTNHTIRNSTFSNNSCFYGAGFFNQNAVLTVINSTLSGNVASMEGGGIYTVGTTTLRNVTITGNSSGASGPSGAGISVWGGLIDIGNTIIAGNIGPELSYLNGGLLSSGNNLIGKAAGDSSNTGSPVIYQTTDILDTPPRLAPFGMYGGTTPTHALQPGSPAINAGNNANAPATDQRGSARIVGGTIDIGAFEYNIAMLPTDPVQPNGAVKLADGAVGTSYSQQIIASRIGGTNPNEQFTFSEDGVLPPGLTLSQSGYIFGTPTASGTYTFTVKAGGADGIDGANQYTITVGCSYSITPLSQNFTALGGNGAVNTTTLSGCQWTAASNVAWITITNNPADPRSGSGSVAFTVQANSGITRQGTITVAGQTFTVNQTTGCSYNLSLASTNVSSSGGSNTFNISSSAGCTWTVVSNTPWITITSGASGTGNGTVTFSVAANTGAARNGTITAGGQTVIVNQASGCTISISPASANAPSAGITGNFNVIAGSGCTWSAVSNTSWINISVNNGTVTYTITANAGAARTGTITAGGRIFTVFQSAGTNVHTAFDYDGDGRADIGVFRPSNGTWYLLNSSSGFSALQFGISSDKLVPADYDGDGKADIAVYRNGVWYLQRSRDGFTGIAFGAPDDIPVAADFDGDGRADIGVFRPSTGTWYIYNLATNQYRAYQFGQAGDIPVVGDYDGDGKADIAVYRPSSGTWYIQQSSLGFTGIAFGAPDDIPVAADFDGDGRTDVAVFRPSNGTWYLNKSSEGFSGYQFGQVGDKPVPADYDGDGRADIAVYRNGVWYLQRSRDGFTGIAFGATNDTPVPAAFIP